MSAKILSLLIHHRIQTTPPSSRQRPPAAAVMYRTIHLQRLEKRRAMHHPTKPQKINSIEMVRLRRSLYLKHVLEPAVKFHKTNVARAAQVLIAMHRQQ